MGFFRRSIKFFEVMNMEWPNAQIIAYGNAVIVINTFNELPLFAAGEPLGEPNNYVVNNNQEVVVSTELFGVVSRNMSSVV